MGLPHLNFWVYLVLPHSVLALGVTGYIWRRGLLHHFPTAYVVGFAAFLALAMVHHQTFLRNQRDWRGIFNNSNANLGMTAMITHAIHPKEGVIIIEPANQFPAERLQAIGLIIRNYWQTLLNYTNQMGNVTH
jgi:hypothetical protein